MATSGNTVAQISRDDIINDALGHLVVLGEGQTANAAQIAKGSRLLNNIVSEFRTLGMSAWARAELFVTLVTGQSSYVIGVGQAVNSPYPTYIYDIQIQQPSYTTEILMNQQAIYDFNMLPPGSTGLPVNYNYQPQVNQGTIRVWPTPDSSVPAGTRMRVTYQRPIEVFDTATDTPDFPQEWGNALTFTLALIWSDTYGVPEAKKAWLEKQADKHVATAASISNEQGSLFLKPSWEGNSGYSGD